MANCYHDSEADLQAVGNPPTDGKKTTVNVVSEKEKVRQMKRSKRASGVRSKPVVPARPVKKGPRPSPLPRKRRASGKLIPVVNRPYISEGDMAQADEMGDVDGHDEGFQDGQEGDNKLRKKTKKKPSSAHPEAYSTSPTPVFQYSGRKRSGFRKSVTWRQSRPKPRPRALRQKLIPADISTQETTTPGPNSSDSCVSGEDVDEEVIDVSVRPSSFTIFSAENDSSEILCDLDMLNIRTQHQVHTSKEAPPTGASVEVSNNVSFMVDNLNYNGVNYSRLGSDLSTAAQSSETSEHEQSGSERQLLYLVARGNFEPLHAMMGNTNSNNGNSSKKTNQSTNQSTSVPVPKPRTGRPPSSVVNGVQLVKEKAEKPKIPPKPAVKPPVKRYSSNIDQISTAVAMKRVSSPGTHTSKRYSIMPLLPSEEGTATNSQPASNNADTATSAAPTAVTTSAVKKALRQYEICEPPAIYSQSKATTKQQAVVKQSPKSSPKPLDKVLSQEELKEIYSFVNTGKLRAQRRTPPPIVKPYKSSPGSSGVEDTVPSDSDSGKKTTNSNPQKSKPTVAPLPKPKPKKRTLERSYSVETLTSPHLERTSRELGKSRSFGPADIVKITQPKGKFSILKAKALSFGRKKTNNESSPKFTIKSEVSPPNTTVQKVRKSVISVDSLDRPHSPQLLPSAALKQSSLDRTSIVNCKLQATGRSSSPRSPRKSPFSSPWDSPSPTPKSTRQMPSKPPTEPQYETAEGFFYQVSRILKKMTSSNRTESTSNSSKNSNAQEEHIYETADGIQARLPLSPATWMKKKLQRSASQATKKSLYVKTVERSIRRTPSMDCLDDRMLRTTLDVTSSDDDDDDDDDLDGSFFSSFRSSLNVSMASNLTLPKPTEEAEVEVEDPLYQHIRTAEFGTSPPSSTLNNNTPLEIARRGSSKICQLWSQQSRVVNSGILGTISREEQKLQEAMFEVIATEGSYVRSLDVLIKHFMEDPGMNPDLPDGRRVLNRRQYHVIFSNVREVHEVARRFLEQLEERQDEGALIRNICDIILDYATNHFSCYVSYCTNQIYQTRQLLECMDNSILFREYVKRLESHDCCQKLQLQSFLLLPMQRITRMPLLILNILNRITMQHKDRKVVEDALRIIQSVVTECNDSARAMERTEQLHTIYNQLQFTKMKPFPLVSASRHLVRSGMLHRLTVESRLFGRPKITCKPLFVYMFTDHIIITKPKQRGVNNKEGYRVIDHASRKFVHVMPVEYRDNFSYPKGQLEENTDYINTATWAVSMAMVKYAFLVSILENVNGLTEHYVFTVNTDSEQTRWVEAINPPVSNKGGETIYEAWDCPQVQAAFDYVAQQPDELSLERGDVVKVFRKMPDGWYEGERMRDLQWGWFPSNFTVEIADEHTRARNLRERYRLLSKQFNISELNKIINNGDENDQ